MVIFYDFKDGGPNMKAIITVVGIVAGVATKIAELS